MEFQFKNGKKVALGNKVSNRTLIKIGLPEFDESDGKLNTKKLMSDQYPWLLNLLEEMGWKGVLDAGVDETFELMQHPQFEQWMMGLFGSFSL